MFSIRLNDSKERLVEIVAVHDNLPLKDENWSERWCTLASKFEECFEKIWNFELRLDDVFLGGFPKSGTTWMQEMLWLLKNQLNFESALKEDLMQRIHVLDFSGFSLENPIKSIEICDKQESSRVIKSHLPVNLLPKQLWEKKLKTIYLARNVKDVVVSSYRFYHDLGVWNITMDEYVQKFIADGIFYAPYWQHIIDFWKLRHEPNIFFMTYEELKRDLAGVLQRLCDFLERPQLKELEMEAILKHLSFEHMKGNKCANATDFYRNVLPSQIDKNLQFIRRGIVGSYKEELSTENQRILNKWTLESLAKHGIREEDIFGKLE